MGPGKRSHVPGLTLQVIFGGVWGIMEFQLPWMPRRAPGIMLGLIHRLSTSYTH